MKQIIIITSSLIIAALAISTYYYYRSDPLLPPFPSNNTGEVNNETQEGTASEPLTPVYVSERIVYSLDNDGLNISFNSGTDWVTVPVEKDDLFSGEYTGNKQELIENSFILTEERALFLYTEGKGVHIVYSLNQGSTWQDAVVTEQFPPMRFRKVAFLNDEFGYVILSGDRTMSQEWSTVFLTNDGGMTWQETNHSGVTRLIYDGGFIDETTGFLSYGGVNPEEPDFYVTHDAGNKWSKANFRIPDKYDKIFVTAEIPFQEGDALAVLLNQGPSGDYMGGEVKGKFISKDHGLTWEFSMEVNPDEQ